MSNKIGQKFCGHLKSAHESVKKYWKNVEDIIEEFDQSRHEILRGNVVTSTRYYQNRVKQFLSKIVLNKDNPMCVELYSYKKEFQERGAGSFLKPKFVLLGYFFVEVFKLNCERILRINLVHIFCTKFQRLIL